MDSAVTAIADAELQRLFSQYQKQVYDLGMAMMSQTSGDVTRDMANHWAGEAHDAFCAALNERLEAAERIYEGLRWMYGYYNARCNGKEDLHAAFMAYGAAYRQSKEHP